MTMASRVTGQGLGYDNGQSCDGARARGRLGTG